MGLSVQMCGQPFLVCILNAAAGFYNAVCFCFFEFSNRHIKHVVVVEGKWSRQPVDWKPFCVLCVVAGFEFLRFLRDAPKDDGNLSSSRVSADCAEGMKLADGNIAEAGFFFQFSCGCIFEFFIEFDKTARNSPLAFEGIFAAIDEQDFRVVFAESENDDVNGDHRAGPVVDIFSFYCHSGHFKSDCLSKQLPNWNV